MLRTLGRAWKRLAPRVRATATAAGDAPPGVPEHVARQRRRAARARGANRRRSDFSRRWAIFRAARMVEGKRIDATNRGPLRRRLRGGF